MLSDPSCVWRGGRARSLKSFHERLPSSLTFKEQGVPQIVNHSLSQVMTDLSFYKDKRVQGMHAEIRRLVADRDRLCNSLKVHAQGLQQPDAGLMMMYIKTQKACHWHSTRIPDVFRRFQFFTPEADNNLREIVRVNTRIEEISNDAVTLLERLGVERARQSVLNRGSAHHAAGVAVVRGSKIAPVWTTVASKLKLPVNPSSQTAMRARQEKKPGARAAGGRRPGHVRS